MTEQNYSDPEQDQTVTQASPAELQMQLHSALQQLRDMHAQIQVLQARIRELEQPAGP